MRAALIHRARLVGQTKSSTRDAEGEFVSTAKTGPWTRARVMERGAVAPSRRRGAQTVAERVERGYELLIDVIDMAGVAAERPTASSVYETTCAVLGNPTVQLSGEPEVLTNGRKIIGYMCYGTVVKDRS